MESFFLAESVCYACWQSAPELEELLLADFHCAITIVWLREFSIFSRKFLSNVRCCWLYCSKIFIRLPIAPELNSTFAERIVHPKCSCDQTYSNLKQLRTRTGMLAKYNPCGFAFYKLAIYLSEYPEIV